MKKYLLIFVVCILFFTGCSKNTYKSITNSIYKKYNSSSGYKLNGILEVTNNDEVYKYNVEVGYKKDDLYRVILTNTANDFKQIIIKNEDGVFLLTPSLNKSLKFQSDWPYDNSQIYLLNSIIKDMKRDKNNEMKETKKGYVFHTSVKYPNNNKLVKQKIVFNKDLMLDKVIVYDKNGSISMEIKIDSIKLSPKFSDDYFELDSVIDTNVEKSDDSEDSKSNTLEDVIYPLVIPSGTKLVSEDRVSKDLGERVIMTYEGEKSFLLVEETIDVFDEFTIIPTVGEPYLLLDTLGVMTDNSLSWSSGSTEYYLVSDVMSGEELIDVAQSLVGVISMK